MIRRLAWLVIVTAGVGCSASKTGMPGMPGDPGTQSGLTYHKDVRPIVEQHCQGCHTQGGIAPFPLETFDDVHNHRDVISQVVAQRIMPPWLAGQGCTDYAGDRSLSQVQIDTITKWADGGAPEGRVSDYAPPAPIQTLSLSRVDRHLTMAAPYTPVIAPDEYRCFILDWPDTQDRYITGFRANPGNAQIVHHVIAFLAPPDQVAKYQQLDAADPAPGYVCFGSPGGSGTSGNAEWLGSWAPGSQGYDFAAQTGIKLPAGSKVILQVHYNHTSPMAPAPDQTSLDFKVDDSVEKLAMQIPWTSYAWVAQHQMDIPAGNPDVMHSFAYDMSTVMGYLSQNTFQSGKAFTIWGTGIHMHTRGTKGRVELRHADGSSECMLDVPRWDFHWQGSYAFAAPKLYQPGDQIYLECHWDNMQGPDTNWGEGTSDEMCLTGFYVTQ